MTASDSWQYAIATKWWYFMMLFSCWCFLVGQSRVFIVLSQWRRSSYNIIMINAINTVGLARLSIVKIIIFVQKWLDIGGRKSQFNRSRPLNFVQIISSWYLNYRWGRRSLRSCKQSLLCPVQHDRCASGISEVPFRRGQTARGRRRQASSLRRCLWWPTVRTVCCVSGTALSQISQGIEALFRVMSYAYCIYLPVNKWPSSLNCGGGSWGSFLWWCPG